MEKQNPTLAVDAILEDEKKIDEYKVYPLSIGRYALLELLKSPFVTPDVKFDTMNVIPGLYVMLHPISDLKGYTSKNIDELNGKAMEWVEDVELDKMGGIVKDIFKTVTDTLKVSPGAGAAEEKKN